MPKQSKPDKNRSPLPHPANETSQAQDALHLEELSTLVQTNKSFHFLQKNVQELKEKPDLKKLLSCYRLSLLTFKDLMEKKEKENQQLKNECEKLNVRLEEFTIPPKALTVIPERQREEHEKKISELQSLVKETETQTSRLQQDFENYRKRTEKRIQEITRNASEHLILGLLPVLDNLERALAYQETQGTESVLSGIHLIKKQFEEILGKEGLEAIQAVGKRFDPLLHEATESLFTDSVPEETILEEIRKGYSLREKVIRPSLVKVAKACESEKNN